MRRLAFAATLLGGCALLACGRAEERANATRALAAPAEAAAGGLELVYERTVDGNLDLYVASAGGGAERRLTDHAAPGYVDTLAAAYAELGRFEDAVKWQQKAAELAPEASKPEYEARLALYREGKPFRDVIDAPAQGEPGA